MRLRLARFDVVAAAALVAAVTYFLSSHYFAPNGVQSLIRLESEKSRLELELASARSKRMSFEKRVALLRPESLDPDMLDEMAHSQLGWVGQDAVIVRLKP